MSTNTLSFILLLPIHVILCCFSMSQINFALFCVMKFNQYRVHVNPFRSDANISLSCTNRFSAAVPEPELVSKFLKRQQHCWNGTERMECCCAIADLERYFYWFYLFSCFFFFLSVGKWSEIGMNFFLWGHWVVTVCFFFWWPLSGLLSDHLHNFLNQWTELYFLSCKDNRGWK